MQAYVNLRLYRKCGENCDVSNIHLNPDLTLETLEMYKNDDQVNWMMINDCPNFTVKWLLQFPNKSWDWGHIHKNPKFEFDWVYKFQNESWNWKELSKLATIQLLRQYPMFKWDWEVVTRSSKVSKTDMANNTDLPWCVSLVKFNDIITDDDITFLRTYQNEIDWECISTNAPLCIVRENMNLPWFHYVINLEKYPITQNDLDFLHETSNDYIWNWAKLAYITPFQLIVKNKHMDWEPEMLSLNPTVTYDDVQNHSDLPWDLTITPCEPIDRCIRRWVAANLIKRRFRNAITNPKYKMCRDRLNNEFESLCV